MYDPDINTCFLYSLSCPHSGCSFVAKSNEELKQHRTAIHRTPHIIPPQDEVFARKYHPHLTGILSNDFNLDMSSEQVARPCMPDGIFIYKPGHHHDTDVFDQTRNPFHSFEDWLAFDYTEYFYVKLQASQSKITQGLDLWLAATLKAANGSDSTSNIP